MTITAEKKKTKAVFDAKRDAEAREKIIVSRIALLMKQPFFGNMATRLELVNADEWLKTCATDGRRYYYNTEFVLKLKQKELEFVTAHEVLHLCYDHIGRRGDRHPHLANIAADYAVNIDLVDQKVGEKVTSVPILLDPKYRGWSFEQIYQDLYDNAEKINVDSLTDMLLDDHIDGDGDGGGDGDGDGNKPQLSAEERQAIRDEIREAMLSAAQAVGAGNCPAGVQRIISELTEPKMNWREIIQQQIESCVKSDFS